jgi:hypothetical protein
MDVSLDNFSEKRLNGKGELTLADRSAAIP